MTWMRNFIRGYRNSERSDRPSTVILYMPRMVILRVVYMEMIGGDWEIGYEGMSQVILN